MSFIKKTLTAATQLVSTTDFHEDDFMVAQERFNRILKAFVVYGLSIPSHNNQKFWVVLLPNKNKVTLKVKPDYHYFAIVEYNREHRFMTDYGWEWKPGSDTPLILLDQLYEEVMEFINDYSDLD